jgi:hypothetical protein
MSIDPRSIVRLHLSGAWKGLVTYPNCLINCGHYFVGLGLVNHMSGTRKPVESAVRDLAVKPGRLLDVDYAIALAGNDDNRHF